MHANRGTALIADDDEFFRTALGPILHGIGYSEVLETASLDEAVEKLTDCPGVSLALFDLAMPGMESAASLRAIRQCFPAMRVAVVSASGRKSDILAALQANAHGYVFKGLGIAELRRGLSNIAEGCIYVPPLIADFDANDPNEPLARPDEDETQARQRLTPRQQQVLDLLVQGQSNKRIALSLELSEGTVKVHAAALFRALGVTSRTAAAVAGARLLGSHHPGVQPSRGGA